MKSPLRTQLLLLAALALSEAFTVANIGANSRSWRTFLSNSASSTSEATTTPSEQASETLSLFSPCKINLFLRIIRKRPDGFHDLASLFQAVGFGDTLELTRLSDPDATQDTFSCNMPGVPVDSSNLVIRALQLMREKTSIPVYFHANLIKQVPAQAGLGGGSANAATALWGANQLMGNPASVDDLIQWSGALGSDITFFLSRGTAYCTGRGEIMTPIDPPLKSGTKVCLVKPTSIGLSTPAVFKALDYDELSSMDPEQTLSAFTRDQPDMHEVSDEYFINDLEPPAFRVVPALLDIKNALLDHGFDHVMMSGSGSTIFCLGEPRDADKFQKEFIDDNRHDVNVFRSEFISRREGEWYETLA